MQIPLGCQSCLHKLRLFSRTFQFSLNHSHFLLQLLYLRILHFAIVIIVGVQKSLLLSFVGINNGHNLSPFLPGLESKRLEGLSEGGSHSLRTGAVFGRREVRLKGGHGSWSVLVVGFL
jgi:hypothetical protein